MGSKAWFNIVTIGGDDYTSWVANFVSGPSYAGLQFAGLASNKKLLPIYERKKAEVDALRGLNWRQEGATFHLLMQIDPEALASGFEQNDLSVAAEVFENVASVLDQSMPFFDELYYAIDRIG